MSASPLSLNIPALLGRIPMFQGLSPEEATRIAVGTREVVIDKGGILFHRGDVCDGFYIVVYGQIKLAFTSPQGGEKVVEIVSAGQSFGEAVMFMDKPYPVMAQALVDSQLIHIGKAALFDELAHHPTLARKMIGGLSMRLHSLITDVEAYSLHSARERVIGFLLRDTPVEASDTLALDVALPTSKGTIASRLNVTQEHFSRILHDLAEQGLIEVKGRTIRIPHLGNLRRFST